MRETEEKIRRAKESQEKRDREKKEKIARKKALVDMNAGRACCRCAGCPVNASAHALS